MKSLSATLSTMLIGILLFLLFLFGFFAQQTAYTLQEGTAADEAGNLNLFTFYYPWYATPEFSGYYSHWGPGHAGITDYPSVDKYDSNNESLIKSHIDIARKANIDGFVVSWWGRNTFEDKALSHIKKVCEESSFKFTIYYETTDKVENTVNDLSYIMDNYAKSNSWYTIGNRPVIYVYSRARDQLINLVREPWDSLQGYWTIGGDVAFWKVCEDVRETSRYAIFVIDPYKDGTGFIQSKSVALPPNDTYYLNVSLSDIRNDCPPYSDVGFRIELEDATGQWKILDDRIVNFNDGWLDLSYNISSYAGQSVVLRVESYDGGVWKWASEWAAVDYLFISNSESKVLSQNPYFDNEWKIVVETLHELGYNPYFIMDFGGYEYQVESFSRYFLNFTDGIHTYNPVQYPSHDLLGIYHSASMIAHSMNKTFVATVTPGYDDTSIRYPGFVADRLNGSFYNSSWSIAKSSLPDEYVITSFNEWHEGSEIEPSLEYAGLYINLTFSNTLDLLSHDISIEDVVPFRTIVGNGSTTTVNVTVINLGDCLENCSLTVYANQTVIGTYRVSNLAYGTGTAVQMIWSTTAFALGNYVLRAEVDQVPGETDTADNTITYSLATISILGDINGDGRVDMKDVSKVAAGFQTHPGDTKWTSNGDLDENGVIDMKDISTIAKHFGEHYP